MMTILVAALAVCRTPAAHAQWAVIDVDAIVQLVQELKQMQQEYQSMTGSRGMQSLLSGTNRNYLSPQWTQLQGSLASPILSSVNANAVLTSAQLSSLSPADRALVTAARQNAALLQAASQEAYAVASSRFSTLQELIDAIGSATDQKGSLELQARIQAEQAMLQNESAKLTVLYQSAQGQEWAREQRTLEQSVADIGSLRSLPPLRLP
jgi:type IV secretion system protein VirB5